jgi:hypothetical protein
MNNNRAWINIGEIVQTGLETINPVQPVVWYSYANEVVTDDGLVQNSYIEIPLKARVQPVSQNLVFKYHLEFGHTYKRFYILQNEMNTVNRNIYVNSDYILFNNLYYRVMQQEDNFTTGWLFIIAMQTNEAPDGLPTSL